MRASRSGQGRGQWILMKARSWAVSVTAWAGLSLGLFWTVGLVLDSVWGLDRPLPLAAASAVAVALPTVLPRLRRPGHLALRQDAPFWRVGLRFLVLCPICWLGLTPLAWALARLLVAFTWPDPNHAEAGLFVLMVSLWLPLWWAPGCAALLVWRCYRVPKQQEPGPA